jgi:hypothetical protein
MEVTRSIMLGNIKDLLKRTVKEARPVMQARDAFAYRGFLLRRPCNWAVSNY